MAKSQDLSEEESFIILGSSPGSSLDLKCDIVNGQPLDKKQMEDAMKDLPLEASMALKAHFKLGDCPSPASMMVASTMITEDKSLNELQKQYGELLDENVILKETLKQNNDSLKEQFLLIASCQEDMLNTHKLHKEKFEETKGLVEKLRQENKKLKQDISRLTDSETSTNASKSGPSSMLEFVTSPDDDTINKLTNQLELVEKQRRQVIVDNEKLTWQKESLEHIVDVTTKERDELKKKLQKAELLLSNKDTEHSLNMTTMQETLQSLQHQLQSASSLTSLSSEEVVKRDNVIRQLETKLAMLQTELKAAQLKLLEFENLKLEHTRQKSGLSETVKMYKDQIQELKSKLKEAQTVVFQPVRVSMSPEPESSEQTNLANNVKLYDRTLKHLSEHLNGVTHGLADNLVELLGVVASLYDFKLERATAEQFRAGLADVKTALEKQHSSALNNIGHVRSTLSIFEGIFKDYKELLNSKNTPQQTPVQSHNVEALTSALLARGQEVQTLQEEVATLRSQKDDVSLLRAQIDLYKSDFEAERECREKMACEKENLQSDYRNAQKRIADLTAMLQEARRQASMHPQPRTSQSAGSPRAPPAANRSTTNTTKAVYTCPKCMRFKGATLQAVDEHLDYCVGSHDDPCTPM